MGMPLYGQSFSLADSGDRGLNAKSYGPGEAGEFTRAGGFLAFYEVCLDYGTTIFYKRMITKVLRTQRIVISIY